MIIILVINDKSCVRAILTLDTLEASKDTIEPLSVYLAIKALALMKIKTIGKINNIKP